MAITRALGRLFLELSHDAGWQGRVLQLGRQSMFMTKREVRGSSSPLARLGAFADDVQFFRALGFDDVDSSDLDELGGAQRMLDLNLPIPDELVGRYDAVYEGGTLGCIFEVTTGLRNVEALLKTGGRAIHTTMSNGYVDEGLYMLSPRTLHDWYAGRGWEIEHFLLVEHGRRWARSHMTGYRYEAGAIDHLTVADFERGALLSVLVARKPAIVREVIPYVRPTSRVDRLPAPLRGVVGQRLLAALHPLLPSRVVRVLPRHMPPRVGRW